MAKSETFEVDSDTVSCDGGGGALGHPRVFLSLEKTGEACCPYCGRHYLRKPGGHSAHH